MAAARNEWWRVSGSLWMSTYWDVYLERGAWRAAFYAAPRPVDRDFATAEGAMEFVDTTDFDDGTVRW